MKTEFIHLFDFNEIQELLNDFYKVTRLPVSILDLEGKVLARTEWQAICEQFHRENPASLGKCAMSDRILAKKIEKRKQIHYHKCKNGLIDVALPLMIRDAHAANLFSGQFLFEKPDRAYFTKQAERYGFDEKQYLDALDQVPIVSKANINDVMAFLRRMMLQISEMAIQKLEQNRLMDQIKQSEQKTAASNQQLSAGEQQLLAVNHQLQASEEQLKAANQQLQASNQQLAANEQQLKKNAAELKKERDFIDLVINSVPTRVFWKDLNSVYLGCNATFAEDAGMAGPEDVVGKTDDDLIWRADADKYRKDDRLVIRSGEAKSGYEESFVNARGERVVWRTSKQPLRDLKGKIIGVIAASENITQEKQAEDRIRQSELKLKNIIDNSTNMFYMHSPDHKILFVSPQVRQYLGYEPEEVMQHWADFITDNPINEKAVAFTEKAIQTGKRQPTYEMEMERKDGQKIMVEVREAPVVENGNVVSIVGSLVDITDRKKAEADLRQYAADLEASERATLNLMEDAIEQSGKLKVSEENYQRVVSNITTAVWKADVKEDGTFANYYTSPVYNELLGLPVTKATDEWEKHLTHIKPEYIDQVNAAFKEAVESPGKVIDIDFEVVKGNGDTAWFNSKGRCFEKNGKLYIFGTTTDVTKDKETQRIIRENAERMRLAADSAGFGIWDLDLKENVLVWDEWMYRLYGISPDNFNNAFESWQAGVHPDDLERSSSEVDMAVAGEKAFDTEFRIVRPDGAVRYLKANAMVIRDDAGNALRMTGINYDITERKIAEDALRKSEKQFRLLAENSLDCIWTMDLRLNFTYINSAILNLTGHTPEEWIGSSLAQHASRREFIKMARQALRSAKDYKNFKYSTFEAGLLRKNGDEVPVEITGKLMYGEKGRPIGFQGTTRNIEERIRAQADLRESESRLRSVVENMPVMMDAFDGNNKLLAWNRECERVTGYSRDEMIKAPNPLTLLYPDADERNRMLSEMSELNYLFRNREYVITCKNGEKKNILWSNISLKYPVPGWQSWAIGLDVTEHRQAQEELKKYQEELEDLVKKRTAELEEKNAFLERMNEAMVDREFRIKELRDEIDGLKPGFKE